jgi:hypothetical protein
MPAPEKETFSSFNALFFRNCSPEITKAGPDGSNPNAIHRFDSYANSSPLGSLPSALSSPAAFRRPLSLLLFLRFSCFSRDQLPRVEAVIVALQVNSAIAKMKEHCKRGLHFCARGERSKCYGENSSPTGFDSYAVALTYL